MRNKLSFVLVVSFLNTLLVTGAVSDFTFRSISWFGYSFNNFGLNTGLFALGMFVVTFIVVGIVTVAAKEPAR
jgi:hypothetical protein